MSEPATQAKAPEAIPHRDPSNAMLAQVPVHPILRLQRTIGNQAVQRLIQKKLIVSQKDDPYEREADEAAESVMRAPAMSGAIQNKSECGPLAARDGACKECVIKGPSLQRKTQTPHSGNDDVSTPSIVHDALQSPGGPLDSATRSFMEARFGTDFSQVRVHTDDQAADAARAIHARAFTTGRDIAFAAEQYSPETGEGKRLLAHELTHVVQQTEGQIQPTLQCQGESNEDSKALLANIQGLPMFALLPQLSNLSDKSPSILKDHLVAHSVGGVRLVLAMRAVSAKRIGMPADFLKTNKLALEKELPKDQVANIRSFLGYPPDNAAALAAIRGLPMYDLLNSLSSLPDETLEDEVAAPVGGSRLLTAIAAVRAKRQRNVVDFIVNSKRDLDTLPHDQAGSILSYLGVPLDEQSEKAIDSDLEINVTIVAPSNVRLRGEGKGQGENALQIDDEPARDPISAFEEGLLQNRSIISGVVVDPDTQEIIGYRVPAATGLKRLVDREGEVAWQSEIGIEKPVLDPIDFSPTPKTLISIGKAGVGVVGKIVLKKGVASGGKVTLGAIVKMRRVSRAIAKKVLSPKGEAEAFKKAVSSGAKVYRTLSTQAAEELVKGKLGRFMAEDLNKLGTIGPFEAFTILTRGHGGAFQAHHIVETAVLKHIGADVGKAPSVILRAAQHTPLSTILAQQIFKQELESLTRAELLARYKMAYKAYPAWIAEVERYFK